MSSSGVTLLPVSKSDCKSLLTSLRCTLEQIDYPNTGIFSECLKLLTQGYLRGRGVRLDGFNQQKEKEQYVLFLADVMWETALEDASCEWFVRWVSRLECAVKEKEVLP